MMLSPGSNDSSTVFSLLAAIADPVAAKAALQEITDASTTYQQNVEKFNQQMQQENIDLAAQKLEVNTALAEVTQIRDNFNRTSTIKTKELSDLSDSLAARQASIDATAAALSAKAADLSSREQLVSARETSVSAREDAVTQLNTIAQAMKDDYTNKIAALQAITQGTLQ